MAQSEITHLFPASFEAEVMFQPGASIGLASANASAQRRFWSSTPHPGGIGLYTYALPASADVTALLDENPPNLANRLMRTSLYLSGTTRAEGVVTPWASPVQAPTNPSNEEDFGPARTIAALKLVAQLGGSTMLAPRTATAGSTTLVASFTYDGKTGPILANNLLQFAQEQALLKTASEFIEDYNAADNFGSVEAGTTEGSVMNIDFEAHPIGVTYRKIRFPVSFYNGIWYVVTAAARKEQLALANANTVTGWAALETYLKQVTRGETPTAVPASSPSLSALWALTAEEQEAAMNAYAAFASANVHARLDASTKPAISLSHKAAALSPNDQTVVKGLLAAGYTADQIDAYIDSVTSENRTGDWLATAAAADAAGGAGAETLAAFQAYKAANPTATDTLWSWAKDKLWPVTKDSLGWLGDTTVSAISKGVDVTADVVKDWGPTGTIAAVSAAKAMSDDAFGSYTPWIIGAVALLLIK